MQVSLQNIPGSNKRSLLNLTNAKSSLNQESLISTTDAKEYCLAREVKIMPQGLSFEATERTYLGNQI